MEINHYLATETFLKMEFEWLEKIIQLRVGSYFNTAAETPFIEDVKPPIIGDESTYERFLLHYDLGFMERVIVAMIAASTLKPEVFDVLLTKIQDSAVVHVEFGGTIKERRFIPTFRTAAFILNENKDALPLILNPIFELSHPFTYFSLLDFSGTTFHTQIDSILRFSPEMEYQLFTGNVYQPKFNHEFPAKALTTKLNWEDLVVSVSVSENLHAMLQWFQMQKNIEQNVHLAKWLKPGFRVLFYGPSGTGKTLAASLSG